MLPTAPNCTCLWPPWISIGVTRRPAAMILDATKKIQQGLVKLGKYPKNNGDVQSKYPILGGFWRWVSCLCWRWCSQSLGDGASSPTHLEPRRLGPKSVDEWPHILQYNRQWNTWYVLAYMHIMYIYIYVRYVYIYIHDIYIYDIYIYMCDSCVVLLLLHVPMTLQSWLVYTMVSVWWRSCRM